MMVPVYRNGMPVGTEEERQAAVEGWVFARFVINQLMQPAMDAKDPGLHFQVFDAVGAVPEKLIFDEDAGLMELRSGKEPWFVTEAPTRFCGRTWVVKVLTNPSFERATRRGAALWAGAGGLLVSLLLFGIAWSLSYTRERALAIAGRMTAKMRETNDRLEAEITERKRSEALYHLLVESLPLSITRKDLQGRYAFANQRFCSRVGKTLPELIGLTDADLYPAELTALRAKADRQVLETGATLETVEERPQRDGTTRYVQAIRTPLYDEAHVIVGLLGIFWDVTDKRRAEAELEHERFLLRTLMDNLPDRIYFKDTQSRFLRNSRGHLQRFGLTDPQDAIGKSDFDFFSEEHARQAYNDEQQLIRSGDSVTKEERETWPDGSVSWALSTKMPLRDEHGKIIGTFGISHDITDRKHAEEAMRLAKETAEEASRAKSQFLASMSHELRTPLNSVIGFANILLKNKSGALGAAELNYLDRVLANGKHLLSLINEILDLSKIEARKVELQCSPVALDVLIRETVAQQESLVRDKPVQLLVDLPAQVAPLQTDAEKLKQVIINLIGNALKFTEQGSVTVRLVADAADQRPLRIEVADTGIGIPSDKLGIIFEAFQQAETGTARKYGGTGLGLTISQALCRLMGFRIEVASEVGRGSTFTILLDAATKEAPKPPATAFTPTRKTMPITNALAELKGKLVLVIDDELDSRTLLTHMIEEFGCHVISANSGEQGLHMAREFRPHLITVDLMMPQLDGWQVIRALKADPVLRDIPVVVVSIVAGENRGRILGAVDVLQKPVARDDLHACLRRSLPFENPRVLLVDDQEDSRQLLSLLLKDEPCEFRTAVNGRDALEVMTEFSPDLILLDLMMPVMDGMTFLNQMRTMPRFQFVPVVVVTAKELSPEESQHLRKFAQDVIRKGDVFEADLRSILRRLLQARVRAATEEKK
jgi:PAS domain S-box-containing protein